MEEKQKDTTEISDEEILEETPESEMENSEEDFLDESAEESEEEFSDEDEEEPDEDSEGDEPEPEAEAADENSEGKSEGRSEEKKKGFFKKKKDKKDEAIEELTDKHKRLMAEFENFRKRTEKEKSAMFEVGAKSVIEKILPIVDNFERGLATLKPEEKGTAFADGMDKIYKQLMTTLEGMDVKPIEAVGKEFDPNLHNAVMHIDDENYGENIVVQEFQKGYTYRDSVVRHSMVQVAN